jgi:hypothetical protein
MTVLRLLPCEPHVERRAPRVTSLPGGTVIANRFTLEARAGRGGTGAVYRARDALSGGPVALKLLQWDSPEAQQRFLREATLLSSLRHPGIVAYVAHGTTETGLHFLAMEWLEGEDLAHRLARQRLGLEESLTLVRHAAEALAVSHQHGVIHRDLKPPNLFLRHGRPEEVVLVDFGLARHVAPSRAVTTSQTMLGSPGYMAPEQVSGEAHLTASADIFSLGCILYECLAGTPPFSAPHVASTLAKILFTEPVPLRSHRRELPSGLQTLVECMLAKRATDRLPDTASLLKAMEELRGQWKAGATAASCLGLPLSLAEAEQQLVSVLLAAPPATAGAVTGEQVSWEPLRDTLRPLLASQGAQVAVMAEGWLVLTLAATQGSATDQAVLAARCALALQQHWPEGSVVLATGRGRWGSHLPVGEAMDRAGQLLRQLELLPWDSKAPVLDEVTAGLLGPGFQLSSSQPGLFLLHGTQLVLDESRPLLGKPTPCVGREQELSTLELAFSTCVAESAAQAVLVTAPAGMGKSRLRHEFLRRQKAQGSPVLVLFGRGDPLSAGSADGLLAQALRWLCGISGGEPLETQRSRLLQRLGQHLPPDQKREVVGFLGELCGVFFPDEHSARLRAARGDLRLMSLQVSRALVAFLQAECAQHPVLWVLEDLHWGDALTVRLMDEALRRLANHPFMVLALARPEVQPLLSSVSLEQRMHQMPLRGLGQKAAIHLVREVLGTDLSDARVIQLVEQAAGNALFLEELIRGVAAGRGESPPETVMAMLQARLMRLESGARHVLLAASLLGRTFWPGGVRAQLGDALPGEVLEHWLRHLTEWEWVEPQPSSRFPGEPEYRFRHALVRDAAYGLVHDSHKPAGHAVAGAWLERAGERDPRVLAEHASLGQQPQRAIHFYIQAAEQLFERDAQGMERCLQEALRLGPDGKSLARLHALQATAAFWRGDATKLFGLGNDVLAQLKPGSRLWACMAYGLYLGHFHFGGGRPEQAAQLGQGLLHVPPEKDARGAYQEALTSALVVEVWFGNRDKAAAFLARALELGHETSLERAWLQHAQSIFSYFFEARPWQILEWETQASQDFLAEGMDTKAMLAQTARTWALEVLGDRAGAEAQLREIVALAERSGPLMNRVNARLNLALLLAGSRERALRQEAWALASGNELEHLDHFHSGMALTVRARVAAGHGELAEAEGWARKACELMAPFHSTQRTLRMLLSQVLLAQGRVAEARQEAELGVRWVEQEGGEGLMAVGLRVRLAEACLAEGAISEGEQALRRALQSLKASAHSIPEGAARERFLREVPENARAWELARQRWDEVWIL